MNLILAADQNYGIGYQGNLLVRLPGDMKYFRKTTLHKTIVMGRKTFESLPGGALKNRENIVLSRSDYRAEGIKVAHGLSELKELLKGKDEDDIFIIGGGEIYHILFPFAKKVYLTKICAKFPADTYFLNIDEQDGWVMTYQSEQMRENDVAYYFTVYEKKS